MFIRNFIYKLFFTFYLKGGKSFKKYKKLSISTKSSFEIRQLKQLNELILFAYNNIPYYKDLFVDLPIMSNGIPVLNNIDDMRHIPFLTKDIIREQGDRLYHPDYRSRKTTWNTSGGSTGSPIRILQDEEYGRDGAGLFAMIKEMRGVPYYEYTVTIWGAARDIYGSEVSVKGKVIDLINNRLMFNAAKLPTERILEFIDLCNQKSPRFMIAYVQSIYAVAKYAKEHNIIVKPIKVIHTGAGQLFPFMRKDIEDVFGCEVFDHYGGREMGALATECKAHNGLHVLGDRVHLELVDHKGRNVEIGETGEVVITRFANRVMPLIRYKVGDTAIWAESNECSCGVVYPRLERVTGRTANNFPLRSGGYISGEFLTLSYNNVAGIINFQIKQLEYEVIIIHLVIDENYDKVDSELYIRDKMFDLFGDNLDLSFEYVQEIPLTVTGKHLFTISELV